MTEKHWNRCDVCGKFIPFEDFESAKAWRQMTTPESDFTTETYETLCATHNDRPAPAAVLSANKHAMKWIDATKAMPDSDTTVLVYCPTLADGVWMGYHDGECWRSVGISEQIGLVTHWMHLPEPP